MPEIEEEIIVKLKDQIQTLNNMIDTQEETIEQLTLQPEADAEVRAISNAVYYLSNVNQETTDRFITYLQTRFNG